MTAYANVKASAAAGLVPLTAGSGDWVYSVIGQNNETHFYTNAQHKIVVDCVAQWANDSTIVFPRAFSYTVSGTEHHVNLTMENDKIFQTNEATGAKREVTLRLMPAPGAIPKEDVSVTMNKMKLSLVDSNGNFVFASEYEEMSNHYIGPDELLERSKSLSQPLNEFYEAFSEPFSNIKLVV